MGIYFGDTRGVRVIGAETFECKDADWREQLDSYLNTCDPRKIQQLSVWVDYSCTLDNPPSHGTMWHLLFMEEFSATCDGSDAFPEWYAINREMVHSK